MKVVLHRIALHLEPLFDRIFGRTGAGRAIDPYIGYATETQLVVRGRVLSTVREAVAKEGQGVWSNFRQIISLFLTDEVANVSVGSGDVSALTDEEGYFTLVLPKPTKEGWHDVPVGIASHQVTVLCPAFVPSEKTRFLVISDIDDTVLETGAYQLWRNLWTSLTGNSLSRHVFPDAIKMMRRLYEDGQNPIFYVSSSPWNFHGFLSQIFDRNALVRGPMFLRDLGVNETQFVTGTHGDHKGSSIDTILEANPEPPAILIGDTGQHDAEVYLAAIKRHPKRIAAVVLREPGPGPKRKAREAMNKIRQTGIPLLHGPNFEGVVPEKFVP